MRINLLTFRFGATKSMSSPALLFASLIVALMPSAQARTNDYYGIVDYKPSVFSEQAKSPFFFSIGKKLKFGKTISEDAPTLFEGKFFDGDLTAVYPSPNQTKAAIVSGGNLYLAEPGKSTILLLQKVTNYAGKNVDAGDFFYLYPLLQWDADSKFIYIVRDKKKTLGAQTFSHDATLVRVDSAEPARVTEVISDFAALHYFLIGDGSVCFDYAPGDGSVIWKCFHQGSFKIPRSIDGSGITLRDGSVITGKPFVSFLGSIYESEIWLSRYGYFTKRIAGENFTDFFSSSRPDTPLLRIQGAYNTKGHYSTGIQQYGGRVLPGGRYVLLSVWHDSFKGQLLLDGLTGQYRELPPNTRVYRNLNNTNYRNVKISFHWTDSTEFLPTSEQGIDSASIDQ